MQIPNHDLEELRRAKKLLENPGLAAKISNLLGTPIEKGFALLPEKWHDMVLKVTRESLQKALDLAIKSMDDRSKAAPSNLAHKLMVAATGAGGGMLGLSTLAVELPISTTIMLRSIADIARSQGERISAVDTKLACLEVFALGGKSLKDDGAETGYFFVRSALARAVSEAADHIVKKGLGQKGAPALMRLIAAIAARFGVVVSEKAAAQAVPVIGAAGGALINTIFIDHFQDTARGHFIVRRLERDYGHELIRQEYDRLEV
jgi:hypothetical protein